MSSFANEKLSLHIRHKMSEYVNRVKATDLVVHLPCLTSTDKEEILAKKDFSGNYIAMQLLMDYLQKRLNWVEQLINALDRLEHPDLAEDLRVEWSRWNQRPVLNVARDNVPPAPPTSPSLTLSERSGDSSPSLVHPVQPLTPPGPTPDVAPLPMLAARSVAPPPVTSAPPPASVSSVVAAPPPASASSVVAAPPPASAVAAAPPASASAVAAPPPASAFSVKSAPPLASASPAVAVPPPALASSVVAAPPPASASSVVAAPPLASLSSVVAAPPPASASSVVAAPPSASAASVVAAPPSASASSVVAAPPTASASPVVLNPPASARPPSPTASTSDKTPLKRPVQDTSPQTARRTIVPIVTVPIAYKVTEAVQHTLPHQRPRNQQPSSSVPEGPVCSSMDDHEQFLSKPGTLLSVTQDTGSPNGLSRISEEPYSGDSGRLEISKSGPESDAAPVGRPVGAPETHLATAGSPGPVPSGPVAAASPPLRQKNGFAEETRSHSEGPMNEQPSSHNEPEENTYDSNCQSSLGNQEVLFNVVHVSEDPSILNNDGQSTSMLGNDVFGASETLPPVQKHDSQSQNTPAFLSTDPDCLSGPNQDQREGNLGNSVNKPGSASPPATRTTVNGSSSHDPHITPPAVAAVRPKSWKPEEKVVARGVVSYCLLGVALVSISLFVAWRIKK